jgi:hypothetical protein
MRKKPILMTLIIAATMLSISLPATSAKPSGGGGGSTGTTYSVSLTCGSWHSPTANDVPLVATLYLLNSSGVAFASAVTPACPVGSTTKSTYTASISTTTKPAKWNVVISGPGGAPQCFTDITVAGLSLYSGTKTGTTTKGNCFFGTASPGTLDAGFSFTVN